MQNYYMPLIAQLRDRGLVEVAVACDTVEDRRETVRERFGITAFTTDYRDVVRADAVDLVVVLTPTQVHGSIARAALEAGKHVLLEKPLALTLEEAAELLETARGSRGHLLCAPFVALSPTYQAIWRHLRQGDIGTVYSARAFYGWRGSNWAPWIYRRPGGGALYHAAVYNVTTLTGLLGPARRVVAMSGIAVPEREILSQRVRVEADDNAHVLLDFGASAYAVVTTGYTIQQYHGPAIELYGSTGVINMFGADWEPRGYELWQNRTGAWQSYPETAPEWPWTDGLRHLVDCIRQSTPPLILPEQAFHVLEILLKAEASGRDGQARPIDSTFAPHVA
jgi:predicted dehydrogenase